MIDAANGNQVSFYHFDRTGSTLALTDASGAVTDAYAYDPYGKLFHNGSNPQPFTFVGRWGVRQEGTSGTLYQMRARYYDAGTQRFLSREPIWPQIGDPRQINPYQYALNEPIRNVDRGGTLTVEEEDVQFREQSVGFWERQVGFWEWQQAHPLPFAWAVGWLFGERERQEVIRKELAESKEKLVLARQRLAAAQARLARSVQEPVPPREVIGQSVGQYDETSIVRQTTTPGYDVTSVEQYNETSIVRRTTTPGYDVTIVQTPSQDLAQIAGQRETVNKPTVQQAANTQDLLPGLGPFSNLGIPYFDMHLAFQLQSRGETISVFDFSAP